MAGYDYARGMSNNAVEAYRTGLKPASKIRGIPKHLIDRYCVRLGWHHTSKNYNDTDFFDPNAVLETFGKVEGVEGDEDAIKALAEWKAAKKLGGTVHENCTVEWTEWSGKGRRKNRTDHEHTGVTVTVKGTMCSFSANGKSMVKKLGGNWFDVILANGMRLHA